MPRHAVPDRTVPGGGLRHAAAVAVATLSGLTPLASASDDTPSFNRDIRPILSRCIACHGPDAAARAADLDLSDRDDATRDRRRGPAIAPGDPDASSLLARITSHDPDLVMPPPGAGEPISADELATLRAWIGAGATYEKHWAWVAPDRSTTTPDAGGDWARRDLDRFVAARHAELGLTPSPEADLATLARRASLDLTGLPPTIEDLDALLTDPAPDAYDRYVDRLLDSPAFGERWARVWLDVARYADTKGYEADRRRTMWPWRDWVIRAFNADLPYDRFTIAQLAGDLLPGGTDDDVLATAFHRNTMTNDEGGTRDEEYRMAAVIDRTNTTLGAWMGLTAECSVCHDHKYDPLTSPEYYQVLAFLNTTQDADRNDERPLLRWLAAEDRAARAAKSRERAALDERRDRLVAEAFAAAGERDATPLPPDVIPILGDQRPPGATPLDEIVAGDFPWDASVPPPPGWLRSRISRAKPDAVRQHHFNDLAPSAQIEVADGDRLGAWVRLDPANPPAEVMVQVHATTGAWEHRAYWGENLNSWGVDGTASRRRIGDLPAAGAWVRLEWNASDIGLEPGTKITGVACTQFGDAEGGVVHWGPVVVIRDGATPPAWLDDRDAWIAAVGEVDGRGLPEPVADAVRRGEARTEAEHRRLVDHWRREVAAPGIAATLALAPELAEIDRAIAAIDARGVDVPVLREQPEDMRRTTHILGKGDWRSPEEIVTPGVPSFLHPLPSDARENPDRLALARWIVDEDNPLTARVHVNRVWERLFGLGIVETQEDFGTQGTPPSNQALLDHLAIRFMDDFGWSHKALCREIATSATYRQSSSATPDAIAADHRNEHLARGPRFRLEAEAIRDAALAASGRLSTTMHGPPVFPPQPDGVWQVVYSGDAWRTAEDDDRYRRSLYTFWRRTSPHPAMTTLDAGSRETCAVRRIRTNTPLQALVLLNDETSIEAAGGLALRMSEATGNLDDAITTGFRLVTARTPGPDELAVLRDLHERVRADYADRADDVAALLRSARISAPDTIDATDLAARIVLANVLLNLDEFVTRG